MLVAIALVAFSGTAMTENAGLRIAAVNDMECSAARFKAYSDARSAGFNHADATSMSYSVYFMCMSLKADEDFKKPL